MYFFILLSSKYLGQMLARTPMDLSVSGFRTDYAEKIFRDKINYR